MALKGEVLGWREVTSSIPQGSVLGLISFNASISELGTESRRGLTTPRQKTISAEAAQEEWHGLENESSSSGMKFICTE